MGRNPAIGRQGPAYHEATLPATPSKSGLIVKQIRSTSGHAETFRRTLRALGLRHYQHQITVEDTPSIRGMLFKVRHLVTVTPAKEA
jgi:large subunit ribosomal protein L30